VTAQVPRRFQAHVTNERLDFADARRNEERRPRSPAGLLPTSASGDVMPAWRFSAQPLSAT